MKLSRTQFSLAAAIVIALAGGGAGASTVMFFRGQSPIVAAIAGWMITFIGWFVSARLSESAQLKILRYTLLNSARIEVVEAIREEQDWAGAVQQLGWTFRGQDTGRQFIPISPADLPMRQQADYFRQNQEARSVLFRHAKSRRNLTMVLEEYEQLFPKTAFVRWQLGFRCSEIADHFMPLLDDLLSTVNHAQAVQAMIGQLNFVSDYSAVLEDLRIHVQNVSLAEITGGEAKPRKPPDPNVVALTVERQDGLLEVRVGDTPWPIRVYVPREAAVPQPIADARIR